MSKQDGKAMQKTIIKRYSEAFKHQVGCEYEDGGIIHALSAKYGIHGGNTMRGWLKKYAREGVRHKLLLSQSPEAQEQVKQLKSRTSQLEKLLAQLMLDKVMLETTRQVAEAQLGVDFKKVIGVSS
jgi:transposase-like protein